MVGFAAPSIRAALCTLSDNAFWLIGVQLLDGVGAGIYGALTPLVIAGVSFLALGAAAAVAFVVFFRVLAGAGGQDSGPAGGGQDRKGNGRNPVQRQTCYPAFCLKKKKKKHA